MVKPKSKISKKSISAKDRSDFFVERVYFWRDVFAFNDVELSVFSQVSDDARATWDYDVSGGLVSIAYSVDWINDSNVLLDEVDLVAFHEVFEAQMFKLCNLLVGFYSDSYIQSLLHEITRKAENSIYLKLKDLN